jgi:hypothetical protein
MENLNKPKRTAFYLQSFLLIMVVTIIVSPILGICEPISFSDNFDDPTTYMLPVNENTKWRQAGISSGTFSTDVGSGGTGLSVRLVDTNPGFYWPGLAAGNGQYFDLSNFVIQAEVQCNGAPGSGGIGFGVYDDTGENGCALVVASLYYDSPRSIWTFVLSDVNKYQYDEPPWPYIDYVDLPLGFDPSQFHEVRMERSGGGVISATLDGGFLLSGNPHLFIDVAGAGIGVNELGDFSFDNFSMTAEPDDRHVVFQDVDLVTDNFADDTQPSWSPDGKKVTYIRRDETDPNSWNVWVQQIDPPKPPVQCTQNSDNVWVFGFPYFSPDSTRVIFTSSSSSSTYEIKIANADGTGGVYTILPFPPETEAFWLTDVSSSCNRLVGVKGAGLSLGRNVFCVEVDQGGDPVAGTVKLLTNFSNSGPIFGHLGEACDRLVFSKYNSSKDYDLYVLNEVQGILNGTTSPPISYSDTRLVPMATGPNLQAAGCFSLDGSLIYFAEDVNGAFDPSYVINNPGAPWLDLMCGAHWEIFAVNPDSPEEKIKLNYYRPYNQGVLHASHDGTKLVFVSDNRDDGDGVVDADIYIVTLKVQEKISSNDGGQIVDGSGTTLDIPANSIDKNTTLSVKTPLPGDIPSPETLPGGWQNIALARIIESKKDVNIDPVNPPILTIHYTDEEISGLDELSLKIFVYNEDAVPPSWEPICGEETLPECTIDTVANTISAPLAHLSTFCVSGALYSDLDGDGIADSSDNCPDVANPNQSDSNENGIGDACEPVAEAGPEQTVSAGSDCMGAVILDGSSSSDPNDDELTYTWTWNGYSATGINPTVSLPLGVTTITLIVNNGSFDSEPDTVFITVIDDTPPEIALSLSPDVLWPPNHKMVKVVPTIQTNDVCCSDITVELVGVQMNEGDAENTFDPNFDIDPETGFIGDDIQIIDRNIFLRAERAGNSNGRAYTITYRATDCAGNTSEVSRTVTVPHDQS